MKRIVGFLFLCSFQIFSQTYLNILLSNDSYKNSQIGELKKITFSSSGDIIYFNLTNGSTISENTANVKRFIFSDIPMGNPLPVELTSFNAVLIGSEVLLKWTTATEINNFGFDVERTNDLNGPGEYWSKIGFVVGNGNSSSPKDYSYTDFPAKGNKYFYRLKQIDNDGQSEYSNVISIDLNIPNQYALHQNYPNPFNPITSITYNLPVDGMVKLNVYDILGNEVAVLVSENQKAGSYTIPFEAAGLASGVYVCKMSTINFNSAIKMMLMK